MREQIIIQELINSENYLSLEYFAKLLQVSTRTISNDIKYLMNDGKRFGFEISLKRQEGYYIKVIDHEKFRKYQMNESSNVQVTSKDRVDTIIALLLLKKDYCTQESIANVLQVSKSIVKVDMAKVEQRLFEHSLQLQKKAHYGIAIVGQLNHRKLYLLELFEAENPFVVENVNEVIARKDFKLLEKQLIILLKNYNLNTNYTELRKLDIFFKICLCACAKGLYEECAVVLEDSVYVKLAKDMQMRIMEIYGLKMNDSDILNIADFLKQKTKPNEVAMLYDEELQKDIACFLQKADKEYHTKFNEDIEFKKSLTAHVSLLLDRLHQSISFSNPLVKEISVKYPVIFNISIKFANMLEEKYHVKTTQDEIGFIATHFAVHMEKELRMKLSNFNNIAIICSSGGGSAFLIKLKLETLFTQSNIQTFSLLEMEEVSHFQPDIIFTIAELDEPFTVPIVLIKELLDDEDIQKVKNMFEFGEPFLANMQQEATFTSLFKKDIFEVFEQGSYQEILKKMASRVEANGYCTDTYETYVLEREKVLSTVYTNGVAIPHPIDMCGIDNMISVGIIKHDLTQDNKVVKLIFLVNLVKKDLESHQNITRVLFDVMSDEKLVAKIRNSISYEDFMKNISNLRF